MSESESCDPQAGTTTLKGPRGNSVPLAVQNPEQSKAAKKGDKVDVTYVEAVAVGADPTLEAPVRLRQETDRSCAGSRVDVAARRQLVVARNGSHRSRL